MKANPFFMHDDLKDPRSKALTFVLFAVALLSFIRDPFYILPLTNSSSFSTVCSPLFPNCESFLAAAIGYWSNLFGEFSSQVMQAVLLIPAEIGILALVFNRTRAAWICLFVVFCAKASILFTSFPVLNYNLYDIIFLGVFLIAKNKILVSKLTYIFLYFACSTIKFDEGWIFGQYFTTLGFGLPGVGSNQSGAIMAGNLVILSQLFFGWLLFARNDGLRRAAFFFFVVFHIYSTAIVGLRFPLSTLPLLFVLFAPDLRSTWSTIERARPEGRWLHLPESLRGFQDKKLILALFIILMVGQSYKVAIPGNEKLSFEGSGFNFFMFDANHQCAAGYELKQKEGANLKLFETGSVYAQHRCSAYVYLKAGQNKFCSRPDKDQIVFSLYSSVNGGALHKVVDQVSLCSTTYNPFWSNEWINNTDSAKTEIRVKENVYGNRVGSQKAFVLSDEGNVAMSPGLNDSDSFGVIDVTLKERYPNVLGIISTIYWIIFFVIGALVIRWISTRESSNTNKENR